MLFEILLLLVITHTHKKRIKECYAHIVSVHHDDYAWWYVLFHIESNKIIWALSDSLNKNIFPNSCLKNRGC